MSRVVALPVVLVAGVLAVLSPEPLIGIVLGLLAVPPALTGRRVSLSSASEMVLSAVVVALVLTVIAPLLPPRDLGVVGVLRSGWVRLGAASLALAVLRLYLASPTGGTGATLVCALFALVGCGGTQSGALFPAAVLAFLVLTALARWAGDPGGPRLRSLPLRYYGAAAFASLLAAVVVVGAVSSVPPLHEWAMGRLVRLAPRATMGFSDRMWLGSLRGLLSSETIVMRLRGPHVDHLRGATYDAYDGGRWSLASQSEAALVRLPESLAPTVGVTGVEFVGPEPERYFVPLGAGEIALDSGIAMREPSGVLRPVAASVARLLWFRPLDAAAPPPVGPTDAERDVPRELAARLGAIAERWTRGASGGRARLEAIERRLRRDFAYSLEFERRRGPDPVLQFLTEGRTGHCEYFASAMVLLARSQGFAARVVGGYRVTEHNPVGDYYVVRERNAHAWVEAFVPGEGWQTFDPTPSAPSLVRGVEMSWLAGLGDVVRATFTEALRALDTLTWTELMTPLGLLVVAFGAVRWWAIRGRSGGAGVRSQLRCFQRLAHSLERRGLVRGGAEPIEHFARRVSHSESLAGLAEEATALLLRYSALRFGDVGTETELSRDIDVFLAKLR